MPSPFPGIDPYLEQHWGDVHSSLIIYARNQLQKVLPKDLRARVEERSVVTGLDKPRARYPDVRIFETQRKSGRPVRAIAGLMVAEPVGFELPDEPETQTFIEIRQVSGTTPVVTVLEVLSPSNKRPEEAKEQYLRKQAERLQAGVSLVEIDLLREGGWMVAVPKNKLKPRLRTPYRVVVRRGWWPFSADYYQISLKERLPCVKVPLRPTDTEVLLDLQALMAQCYQDGGYDDIDYTLEPEPPLPPAVARWVECLLRQNGRRAFKRRGS